MDTDVINHIYKDAIMGLAPEDSIRPYNEEELELYREIKEEIDSRPGVIWEIPGEWGGLPDGWTPPEDRDTSE